MGNGIETFKNLPKAKLNAEKVDEWLRESGKDILLNKPQEQRKTKMRIQGDLFANVGKEVLGYV